MTKTILKKPIIATIVATILLGTILTISNTLTNDVIAQTSRASSPCPADGEVQHWDKIIFEITKDISKTIPKEKLKKTMDLKIIDTPEQVVDLEQEVANAVGEKFDVDPADLKIKIKDVLYQTVTCVGSGTPGFLKVYNVTQEGIVGFAPLKQSVAAFCDPGDVATGGGYILVTPLSVIRNVPAVNPADTNTPIGWNVTVIPPAFNQPLKTSAVCLDITP